MYYVFRLSWSIIKEPLVIKKRSLWKYKPAITNQPTKHSCTKIVMFKNIESKMSIIWKQKYPCLYFPESNSIRFSFYQFFGGITCVIENDFAFSHVVLGSHSLIQTTYSYKFPNWKYCVQILNIYKSWCHVYIMRSTNVIWIMFNLALNVHQAFIRLAECLSSTRML
jgi:hypothetical protein